MCNLKSSSILQYNSKIYCELNRVICGRSQSCALAGLHLHFGKNSLIFCVGGDLSFDCGSAYVAIPFFYIGSSLSAIIGSLKCENTGNNMLRRIKV